MFTVSLLYSSAHSRAAVQTQSKLPSISLCKVCRAKHAGGHSADFPSCIWPSLYHQMKASTNVLDITEQGFFIASLDRFPAFCFSQNVFDSTATCKIKTKPSLCLTLTDVLTWFSLFKCHSLICRNW